MGRAKKNKPVTLAGMQNPLVTAVKVDDPYEKGSKIVAMRALRDDPLARLRAREQIDDAQYEAGRAYQRDWERAERGPKAIDPTKEAVDGGIMPEPITDDQRSAAKRLNQVIAELGTDGVNIIFDVLVSGMNMIQVAERRGLKTQRWVDYFSYRFRLLLDELAVIYGYAQKRRV